MTFEITHLDGTVTNYSFAPEHKDEVRNFYKRLYDAGQIMGWALLDY